MYTNFPLSKVIDVNVLFIFCGVVGERLPGFGGFWQDVRQKCCGVFCRA